MIDHDSSRCEHARDIDVTAGASRDRLTFGPVLEVTQKARRFRNRHVVALYHLRMATRAAKLLAPTKLAEVAGMVEVDSFEIDIAFQLALGVAPGPQARRILDLGPGLGSIRARHVLHNLVGGPFGEYGCPRECH